MIVENKTKQQLGQFFTKNSEYILQGLEKYIINKEACDPFCGNQDLINWAKKNKVKEIKGFDIDEKYVDNKNVYKNDSIKNPLKYKFVITNPPYIYINRLEKSKKGILKKTAHTDLYQISLEKIMNSEEGIVIVPINFLSAENSKYIRNKFLLKFNIEKINFFTQQVFKDTTYNIISFYYKKKTEQVDSMDIKLRIFPQNIKKIFKLERKYNWQIGGEFLDKIKKQENSLGVRRIVEADIMKGSKEIKCAYNHLNNVKSFFTNEETKKKIKKNVILLKSIDTGTTEGKIRLEDMRLYNIDSLISVATSRNQIAIFFEKKIISTETQEKIIKAVNKEIQTAREKYYSLFMTNYRDNNRKRISFHFMYKLINYIYFKKVKKNVRKQRTLFAEFN